MTAIALMICRFELTDLSYHAGPMTLPPARRYIGKRNGLSWQIVPAKFFELVSDPDQEKTARVMQAMFGMTKFDIAALERAYAGE
jgi:hypothetical protein